jgi:hypothetical protein
MPSMVAQIPAPVMPTTLKPAFSMSFALSESKLHGITIIPGSSSIFRSIVVLLIFHTLDIWKGFFMVWGTPLMSLRLFQQVRKEVFYSVAHLVGGELAYGEVLNGLSFTEFHTFRITPAQVTP